MLWSLRLQTLGGLKPTRAANRSPGWYLHQSTLDMWAVAGGKVTAYLRGVPNLLGLSVIPLFCANMLTAWTTCGRLSLSKKYNNEE